MRHPVLTFSVTLVLCGGVTGAASAPASAPADAQTRSVSLFAGTSGWLNAREVPGTASLNIGGNAAIQSVSCPSPGNCTAGGFYGSDSSDRIVTTAFVVGQRGGRWGQARELPGIGALHTLSSQILTVSCSSPGNCATGGDYSDDQADDQAMVATERNGRWGRAIEVPGTAALNVGGNANVDSVSCWSPGDCAAGGYYEASQYNGNTAKWQAWVATQHNGTWGRAIPLLRVAAVNDNTVGAAAESVSCAGAGQCAAVGAYQDGQGHLQAFVAGQRHGRWQQAIEVPGTAALNSGGAAETLTVSCAPGGSCGAGGYYTRGSGAGAFVVSGQNGKWAKAITVPGTARLNAGRSAALIAMSCPHAGRCSAGGAYTDRSGHGQAFVVTRT